MYHRDRTKNAFVYDGNENEKDEVESSHNQKKRASSQDKDNQTGPSKDQVDFGYGGYKRGHPDVKADW